ncbi:hypothetical protein [Kangiella sp. TOML190]|uniref:hypothetical protein n=1 Tax=Kangiella sp. TOML190 TaxID=2931351 RepID=UPI00203F5803|nr:hypothetical protein [Kangiella sp. TOML190]
MSKQILAVVVALVVAGLVIMGIESINMARFPWPENLSVEDKKAFAAYVKGLPISALVTVLIAHITGAFVAGFLSSKIAAANKLTLALICGAILLLGAIVNIFMIPHPGWFMVVNLLTIVPAAILGGKLAIKNKSHRF